MRDVGSSQAVLEAWKGHCSRARCDKCSKVGGNWSVFGQWKEGAPRENWVVENKLCSCILNQLQGSESVQGKTSQD